MASYADVSSHEVDIEMQEAKMGKDEEGTKDKDSENVLETETLTPAPQEMATMSELLSHADGKDKIAMFVGIGAAILSGANQPAQLVVFGTLLNTFNGAGDDDMFEQIRFLSLMYLILACQMFICQFLQTSCLVYAASRQIKRLRELYFATLLSQNVAYFDEVNQGEIATSVIESTIIIQDGMSEKLAIGIQSAAAFVAGFCVALYYTWQLTLLLLAVVPVMITIVACAAAFGPKASSDTYNAAGSAAQEALGGIRTVFAFGAEKRESDRYAKSVGQAEVEGIKKATSTGAIAGFFIFVMWNTYALGLWFGSKLIADDMDAHKRCTYYTDVYGNLHVPESSCVTGGNVMIAFFCVLFGGLNLAQAVPSLTSSMSALVEYAKIKKVLERTETIANEASEEEISKEDDFQGSIEFMNVAFSYPSRPDHPVYKSLSLHIEAGTTVALVGSSGCGKSTLVSLLERFYDIDAGDITLDGRSVKDLNVQWLRQQIGLVSQEPVLFSGSIADNIKYGRPEASQEEIESAAKQANAHTFISDFKEGYNTEVGERGIQLSGGQKQRIAIARAIVRNPRILILDEATSALDTASEAIVQEALDNLMKQKARTTIMIAHRLSTIRNADKILCFDKGSVVEQGTHDELYYLRGLYYNLCTTQASLAAKDEGDSGWGFGGTSNSTQNAESPNATTIIKVHNELDVVESGEGAVVQEEQESEEALKAKQAEEQKVESSLTSFIWKLSEPERVYLCFGVFGAALNGAAFPLLGYFLSTMITAFFNTDTDDMRKEAQFWAFLFIGMAGVQLVSNFTSFYCFGVITEKLASRVRTKTFEKMMSFDIEWFDAPDNTPGALAARLATDCVAIKALTGERAATSTSQTVTLVVALAIAFTSSWKMTLIMLGLFPVIGAAFGVQIAAVQQVAAKAQEATNYAGSVASQAILNIRTVVAFNLEEFTKGTFAESLEMPLASSIRTGLATGVGMGFAQFVILGGAGLAYFAGGELIKKDELEFPALMSVILSIMFGAVGLGQLAADATDKSTAIEAAKKIKAMWELEPKIKSVDAHEDFNVQGKIAMKDVKFSYPSRPDQAVYPGLSVNIEAGTTVALVGSSGCGKSTLVSLLERFYDIDAGDITLDGRSVKDLNVQWLRQQIGLVSQEPVLFSGSIADNIKYGRPEASQEEIESAAKQANAHTFISDFKEGYNTEVGERGIQLSGGQKQRIAIARAIVRNPRILILDEATSALDTASEAIVQEALDELAFKSKGRTTIIIAHRLSTIRNADKIIVLSEGQMLEEGTHDELMGMGGKGFYRDLHTLSSKKSSGNLFSFA